MRRSWRWGLLLMPLLAGLVLGGCGFKDIDKRFFAVSVGIDRGTDNQHKYKVTLKLAIPSAQEKFGSNQSLLVSEQADTMSEAVRIMKSKVDKEIDFGHAKAILFGDSLVHNEAGIREVTDWLIRRRDIQKVAWVAAARPDSVAILQAKPKTERLPSNMLFLIFGRSGTETAYVISEYLFDFYRRMHERGMDPLLPVVEDRGAGQITVNKSVLFSKEKQKLELSTEETKILNEFYEQIGKVDVKIKDGDHDFVLAIDHLHTGFTVLDDNRPKIKMNIRMTGVIEESHLPIKDSQLNDYEKLAEKTVENRVESLVKKLQEANVDPIGFGLKYRSKHKLSDADWERWLDMYPSLEVVVESQVTIRSTGLIE